MSLTINLLGGLTVEKDGSSLPKLISRKADMLLAYLAQEQRPVGRETIATLLWEDRTQKQSMSNLRTLISSLRKHAGDFVTITRKTAVINETVWVDTAVFQQQLALADENWPQKSAIAHAEEALALYRGEFLDGVLVDGSFELESWMQTTRDRLRHLAIGTRQKLVAYYLREGDYAAGIQHAIALLQDDPLDESVHRQMMLLLAKNGQRSAAIAQYESCVEALEEELGVPPEQATTELYERIQTAVSPSTNNLPARNTTFVGRRQELTRCLKQLQSPDCRLLTLVGLGGIGKTRLALQVATTMQSDFLNGVYFIALSAIESPAEVANAIIEVLPAPFYDTVDSETQLLNYLRGKEMLLILDNFEDVLPSALLVNKILQQAPTVKLLITSRIRLDLQAEWLLELDGLPYPDEETAVSIEPDQYAAIRLFNQRAQVIAPTFTLSPDILPSVNRICQIVHGIPLGIELAAAWIRFLPIDEIAERIAQNLDLLATTMRDVPERQRSLTAVFDYVWSLLNEDEQMVFAKLSLFRGSFDMDAFRAVTEGSPWALAALVEKSLLHRMKNGRYTLIEALRLYATTKLSQLPEKQQTQQKHSHHYAKLLHQQEALLQSYKTQSALTIIHDDLDNIHTAWAYAVANQRIADLALGQLSLTRFYIYRGPYQEGESLLATAVKQLLLFLQNQADPDPVQIQTLAQLYNSRAQFADFTANFDAGIDAAKAAIEWSEKIDDQNGLAEGYLNWGTLSARKGEYETAVGHLQQAIALAQENDNPVVEARAYRRWGNVLHRQSHYEEAKERHLASLSIARRIQQPQIITAGLRGLGNVNRILGEYTAANAHYEESIAIAREIGDLVALHAGLINRANVAGTVGDYASSTHYYQQVLPFYQEMGNRHMEATCLLNLGGNAAQLNQFQTARNLYQEAYGYACEINSRWVEHVCLLNLAETLCRLGHYQQAVEHGRAAVHYFEEIDETMARSYAFHGLGETYLGLNRFDEAESVLQDALAIRRQGKNQLNAMATLAMLSRVYLARGDERGALTAVEEIMQFMEDGHSLVGSDMTMLIYAACYDLFLSINDPRKESILQMAYDELQNRANNIQDEAARDAYLQSTLWHQTVLQTCTND